MRMVLNAEVAAKRLVTLTEHLLAGKKHPDLFVDGPCSKAGIVKDTWFCEDSSNVNTIENP